MSRSSGTSPLPPAWKKSLSICSTKKSLADSDCNPDFLEMVSRHLEREIIVIFHRLIRMLWCTCVGGRGRERGRGGGGGGRGEGGGEGEGERREKERVYVYKCVNAI